MRATLVLTELEPGALGLRGCARWVARSRKVWAPLDCACAVLIEQRVQIRVKFPVMSSLRYNKTLMYTVTLLSWTPGFVVNRLVQLLRNHKVGLAAAHDLASRLAEGRPSAVVFQTIEPAERFAAEAEGLGVQLAVSYAAAAG